MDCRKAALLPAACMLASLVASQAPLCAAAPDVKGVKQLTSIEGITEYELPNGFKVLLFPDASKPTVTINMTVLVGSRHEGYGEAGMAHLLEHMLFKGTPYPEPTSIPAAMKERGAGFNASTWFDRTNYSRDAGLDRCESRVRHPARSRSLDEQLYPRRRLEVGDDRRPQRIRDGREQPERDPHAADGGDGVRMAQLRQIDHRQPGRHRRVPAENLHEFYTRYYQPDNTILVVAGKFQPKKVLELVAKYFGPIPRPERVLNSTYTEEPPQDGERFVRLRRVGGAAVVGVTYHIPAGGEAEFPAVEVLADILADEPSGPLYKSLVETKKAATVYGEAGRCTIRA